MGKLREIREAKKVSFSQHHLSSLTGIDQKRVSLLERGLVEPRSDEKRRIAAALGVSVEELWPKEVSGE